MGEAADGPQRGDGGKDNESDGVDGAGKADGLVREERDRGCVEAMHGLEAPAGRRQLVASWGARGQQCGYWFRIYKKGFSMR